MDAHSIVQCLQSCATSDAQAVMADQTIVLAPLSKHLLASNSGQLANYNTKLQYARPRMSPTLHATTAHCLSASSTIASASRRTACMDLRRAFV